MIDDDISSLTNFREKEKNTSQLLNFDFFNLLSNTGLRVSNIALLIPTGDRGQSKSRFRVRPRIAGKIRTGRNEGTRFPLSMIFHYPWTTPDHARVIAAECAWRTRRAKLKNQNAAPLPSSLFLSSIARNYNFNWYPPFVFVPNAACQRARRCIIALSISTLTLQIFEDDSINLTL